MELSRQKCRRHGFREAAAICPECGFFYCRECVTEHDDKVICADCLLKLTASAGRRSNVLRWVFRATGSFVGLFLVWLLLYGLGRTLLAIPSSFHEGTIWVDTVLGGSD